MAGWRWLRGLREAPHGLCQFGPGAFATPYDSIHLYLAQPGAAFRLAIPSNSQKDGGERSWMEVSGPPEPRKAPTPTWQSDD